jgi:2-keto-myo-inositol isomerase
MIEKSRISLNRILSPSLSLGDFLDLAASLGLNKVELRNDIGEKDPIDGLAVAEAARLVADRGMQIITINALQKFNLPSSRARALVELDELIGTAKAIGCPAIVFCPNNDSDDSRNALQRADDTVEALKTFGPRLEAAGILGYVEPLGFSISSLASLVVAQEAIKKSGFSCYRVVLDTFHRYIGSKGRAAFEEGYDVSFTGLVHVSGVEADIPLGDYRDEHRILAGPADRMRSKEQISHLDELGYRGDLSFEPFSSAVQALGKSALQAALAKSLEYLLS